MSKKTALGREWSGSELMNYLKNEAPFSILNSLDCLRIISSDILNTRNAKHLIVHMIHSRVKPAPMMNPQDTHLVATVSLLNAKGDSIDGYHCCLVEFNSVLMYIGKHQGTKNRYLFCSVINESVGEKFNA